MKKQGSFEKKCTSFGEKSVCEKDFFFLRLCGKDCVVKDCVVKDCVVKDCVKIVEKMDEKCLSFLKDS